MKTIRGCLVIFFSMLGLNALAQSFDVISDETDSLTYEQISAEAIQALRLEIEFKKRAGQDVRYLENQLRYLSALPSDNEFR